MSSKTESKKKDSPVSSQVESSDQSKFSPSRYSRLNEKKELANLNDRLACYIDRVRNLEIENERLTREVKTSEETITTKVTSVKTIYENELSGTRKLLDELSREKAKLEIDAGRLIEENEGLSQNLTKKINECRSLEDTLSVTENRLSELSNKYNLFKLERMKVLEENKTLVDEKNKLASMVLNLQKNLEEEILSRVSLQNAIQTTREEYAFKEQVLQQQLIEYKKKTEVTEVEGQLTQVCEERFYESLLEIREQSEIDLENNKKEIKKLYEEKVRSLEAQLMRYSNNSSFALEEMRQIQVKLDEANNRLADAEEERNIANQKTRDLMREFERLKSDHMSEITKHNLEMTQLREEMTYQVQRYEELMNEKVALDLEIAAYGKLLEGEETRLNITPVTNLSNRTFKRKRVSDEENGVSTSSSFSMKTTNKGNIKLSEIDVVGKFIRLENKGNKEVSLSGWHIVQTSDDAGNAHFKFHRSVKIKPGASVTVWSSDSDQTHKPPENIVMTRTKWLVGDKVSTLLINNSGEEVASTSKQQSSSFTFTPEMKFNISGEKYAEERCILM